jgi:hypothetical protein
MEKIYYRLPILMILVMSGIALSIASTDQAAFTIYVHEGDLNGTMLPDVTITGNDAEGNTFEGITDSGGIVTITGQPGTWHFTFEKEGYETLVLDYDVTETDEAAAFLEKTDQSDVSGAQAVGQVGLTVFVHEGDLNGTMLSDVTIIGNDAEGNTFEGITDSGGIVTITGQPGTWHFTFEKEGYETLVLDYDVTEAGEAAAYLLKISESNERIDSNDQPSQSDE